MRKNKNRKRRSPIFLIECVVIAVLVMVITSLLKTEPAVLATSKQKELMAQKAERELFPIEEISAVTESQLLEENSVSDNGVSGNSISENSVSVNELLEANGISANDLQDKNQDGKLEIVVFGDSIWDNERGADGVAALVAEATGAQVYNCAMGGTSAALISETSDGATWDSRSLNGMVYVAVGRADAYEQLDGYDAKEYMRMIDFSTVDYVIFSYGLNDYFSGVEIYPEDLLDMTTYVGALRHATQVMKQTYPQAEYIIMTPTYCRFMYYDRMIEDCTTRNYGGGVMEEYVNAAKEVAREYNVWCLDAYHDFGIDASTGDEYLLDGTHFTAAGRKQYAKYISDFILAREIDKAKN